MTSSPCSFIGIDPSGGKKPYTFAILDENANIIDISEGEFEDTLFILRGQEAATIAVCAPQRPNQGILRQKMEEQGLTAGHLRGTDMRMAEFELRQRNIPVSATPGRHEMCPAWVQSGFTLYEFLFEMGYKPYSSRAFPRQFLETHPHAIFCALLEHNPLPKPTLEGRMQRQMILYEKGLGLMDPMDFFEEVTRHKLIKGILPMEMIHTPEQLDVLAAAYCALLAYTKPEEISFVGSGGEGRVVLPVKTIKDHY